jgi:hypothetical protein
VNRDIEEKKGKNGDMEDRNGMIWRYGEEKWNGIERGKDSFISCL